MTRLGASKDSGGRHGFPRQVRLLRGSDYRRVYSKGRRRSLGFLVAFSLANEKPFSRIGLTVPRALGGAVDRNLLKRRLREASRRHLPELGPGWDIIFNPRLSAKPVSFARLEATVENFFQACSRSAAAAKSEKLDP